MSTLDRPSRNAQQRDGGSRTGTDAFDRSPPHSLDAEKGVLGSIMLDPRLCDDVALAVRPDDFYSPSHRKLFELMLEMHNTGKHIDTTLLIDRLKTLGEFETIGGTPFLADIIQCVPTAHNAVHYAKLVSEKAIVRELIHASTEILRDAYDLTMEPRELLAQSEAKIFSILEDKGGGEVHAMTDVLNDAMLRISDRVARGGGIGGISTGLRDLDKQTGGLHDGELVILAARPSMGKTALATTIAENVALRDNHCVFFASLEMSRLELAERMLCSHGKINGTNLRSGILSPSDRSKLIEASSALSTAPIFIDDNPGRTITEIAAAARRLKRRNELRLIVIDYLQLIEPDNAKDPRQEQVSKIARRLKGMARELKVPVLCLSQLNRQTEASKDNIPKLSHLRESGAIEQDADVVMFVHREEYYVNDPAEKERLRGKAELIIAKQRNGPVGNVPCTWVQNFTRFEDRAAEEYDFT